MDRKFIKPIIMVIAILLVVVLAAGFIAQTVIKKKGENITADGAADRVVSIEATDDRVFVGNEAVTDEPTIYAMPANIVFYEMKSSSQTMAQQSITVRATVTPANADNQKLVWESDDPDIVSVVASASDSHIATITKLRTLTFGEVIITVRSVDNPNAYATCRIDQLISGSGIEFDGYIVNNPPALVFGNTYNVSGRFTDVSPGIGTILGDTENIETNLYLTNEFIDRVDHYLSGNTAYRLSSNDGSWDTNGTSFSLPNSPKTAFVMGEVDEEVFNHAFKMAMNDISVHATLTISGDYTYNGRTYKYGHTDIPVSFSQMGIWVGVDGVQLGDDNIVFYD